MPLPTRDYDRNLNSEIERLLYQNEVIVMDARGLVTDLTDDQFNWAPDAKRWSVGQCLEHLNITYGKWLPHFEETVFGEKSSCVVEQEVVDAHSVGQPDVFASSVR